MVEINEGQRGVPRRREVEFKKPVIDEFEAAIQAIGGHSIVADENEPKKLCIVDTANRLAACLYEKALYGTKVAQESLAEFRKKDIHHIADMVNGSSIKNIINVSPIHLDTAMSSLSVILSKGSISGRLTPSGLIALSALARSPSERQAKERTRKEAVKLLVSDPVASYLYLTNPGAGFFNGTFPNSSLPSIIDMVVSPQTSQ